MKIYIHTLGCKVNQFESQALETLFRERGYAIQDTPEGCDIIILNTCAVTAESVRKCRQALRHMAAAAPGAVIGVCGCWSQLDPETPLQLGANVIFGSSDRIGFANALEQRLTGSQEIVNVDQALKRRCYERLPAGNTLSRTRALLKIEDGCVNFCSYCIIPYTRGPVRSLPVSEAAEQASILAGQGYREIVVTGIEVASYGRDLPGKPTLGDVVASIASAAPECRLRLGSIEPRVIDRDFCEKLSSCGNVCPHFHLSLQSGCDDTLKRMNRKYDTALFYNVVRLLRSYFPSCGITTDLIVGFPGETEDEFLKTLDFIEKCSFSSMHIFPYSVRKGTVAAQMNGQINRSEKHSRVLRASAVAKRCRDAFLSGLIGTNQQVLFEQQQGDMWTGHCGNYALAAVKGDDLHNCIQNVQITGMSDGILLGEITL